MKKLLLNINPLLLLFLNFFISQSNALENIIHWQTENGLPVYWVYSPSPAMVDVELLFAAGSAYDGEQSGLANATNSMFYEYAAGKDQAYWAEQLENLGAEIGLNARRESASISLRSISNAETLNEALSLWISIITEAEFREIDWRRVREQLLSQLRDKEQEPGYLANTAFYKALFPDQALGNPTLGTKDSLLALSVADLKRFQKQFYHRDNAKLVIVGDLTRQQAEALAEKIANALPSGTPASEISLNNSEAQQKVIQFPSQQAHIVLGYVTIARTHPDYYPLLIANHLLGGNSFSSRLMQKIRVEHGLTYGIYSSIVPLRQGSIFSIRVQTRVAQSAKALDLITEVIKALREEGISDEEFEQTKANLINNFPLGISSNRNILQQAASIAFYDLELDRLAQFQARIGAVSKEAVEKAIKQYFLADAFINIQIGDFSALGN
jgi:zinc protease